MSSNPVELFVAVYDDEGQAKEALKDFKAAEDLGSIDLIDAAVVVRKADGKVKFEETVDPGAKTWGKRGAIVGGLVGLIFPPSLIGSAIVGGGAGALWGKIRDKGIPDEELKAIGESMDPGTSAIIAIAQDRVLEQLEAGLEGYDRISRHALSAEASAAVIAEADDSSADS
jgi:uncharacterized membrane protein